MSLRTRLLLLCLTIVAFFAVGVLVSENSSAQKMGSGRKPSSTSAASVKSPAVPSATPILTEDFNYAAAAALTSNGWSAHSGGGTNTIVVTTPGLTYTGYPGSGVGNAASLVASGEDINKTFTLQTSGSVYAAAMVQVTAATTTGDYFMHFITSPVDTNYRGRVFAKRDASNNVAFGISKSTTTDASISWTPFSYSLNTTYLIVLKYQIVDGTTNDVTSMVVINGTIPTLEPSATVTSTDNTSATVTDINPGSIALRQGTAGNGLNVKVDGIRVGTFWDAVTQTTSATTQKPNLDFNGDGKTDFAVTRDNGGNKVWYTSLNGPGTFSGVQWGLTASDWEVPADYDGDGKADIAVWRQPSSGEGAFYILRSSDSTVQTEAFGQNGDDPSVTADYDGDGKADPAVFRCPSVSPGQCYFYYRGSLNNPSRNITFVPWGYGVQNSTQVTIRSAAGDYDGDGKYDFCVFLDGGGGAGMYILLKSSNFGVEYVPWGLATDLVIPRGDFDGDGKTDFAVTRLNGSNYNTYTLTRTGGGTGASPYVFGGVGDEGTLGDYDGDGKSDVAVWRASNGTFYIVNSSTGLMSTYPWGINGDIAIANWIFPGGQ